MGGVELGDLHYDIAQQMHRAQCLLSTWRVGQTSPFRKQLAEEINIIDVVAAVVQEPLGSLFFSNCGILFFLTYFCN